MLTTIYKGIQPSGKHAGFDPACWYVHSWAVFCGHLWSLFSILKSCVRSIPYNHRKPFISKIISPNSQQWTSSNFDNEIQPGWNAVYIPYFIRNVLKGKFTEIPSSVHFGDFNFTFTWLATFFHSFQAPKKADLWAHLELNVGTKRQGVSVGFLSLSKVAATIRSWFHTKMEMDPKNKLKNWFNKFQRHSQVSNYWCFLETLTCWS